MPNPANEWVMVKLSGYLGKSAQIQIVNDLGQVQIIREVEAISEAPIRLDVSNLQNGIHALSVKVDNLKLRTTQFVVEHAK